VEVEEIKKNKIMRKYIFVVAVMFMFMGFIALVIHKTYTSPYLTSFPYFLTVFIIQSVIWCVCARQLGLLLTEYLKS